METGYRIDNRPPVDGQPHRNDAVPEHRTRHHPTPSITTMTLIVVLLVLVASYAAVVTYLLKTGFGGM